MRIKNGFFWNKGFRIIFFSISSLILAYLIYTKFTNPSLNDLIMVTPILFNLSIIILIITFMSSVALCFGLWSIFVSKTINNNNLRYYISIPFREKKYIIIMILTGISYGIVFSFLSQIFVINNSAISFEDNKSIPSIKIIPCCNNMGYVPMTYIYLTENFFIFLIPINIVLIFMVSFLVGLNITINIFMINKIKEVNNKQPKILGSIGVTCGLFIGCPTCAGSIIAAIFGISAGTTTLSLLASFQTLFIALSIPALLCAPLLIAKTLKRKITKNLN